MEECDQTRFVHSWCGRVVKKSAKANHECPDPLVLENERLTEENKKLKEENENLLVEAKA